MGRERNRDRELGFKKEVIYLGSKLASVIVSLVVVLGLVVVLLASGLLEAKRRA